MRSALDKTHKPHLVFQRAVAVENHVTKYWWFSGAMSSEDTDQILPNICGEFQYATKKYSKVFLIFVHLKSFFVVFQKYFFLKLIVFYVKFIHKSFVKTLIYSYRILK